jgi:hypothetical protein
MVEHLTSALTRHGVERHSFNLIHTDIGELANELGRRSTRCAGLADGAGRAHPAVA